MSRWQVQEAKARFSELLEAALAEGPQIVTKRGVETAVLVTMEEWRRLQSQGSRSLKSVLLSGEPKFELPALPRGGLRRRTPAGTK
jgi:antitoxin Phd